MLELKKNSFGIFERFSIKCKKIFFLFYFSLSIENEKKKAPPPFAPSLTTILGGSSAASPLEIWDVMPPYLKRLFEQKAENL